MIELSSGVQGIIEFSFKFPVFIAGALFCFGLLFMCCFAPANENSIERANRLRRMKREEELTPSDYGKAFKSLCLWCFSIYVILVIVIFIGYYFESYNNGSL